MILPLCKGMMIFITSMLTFVSYAQSDERKPLNNMKFILELRHLVSLNNSVIARGSGSVRGAQNTNVRARNVSSPNVHNTNNRVRQINTPNRQINTGVRTNVNTLPEKLNVRNRRLVYWAAPVGVVLPYGIYCYVNDNVEGKTTEAGTCKANDTEYKDFYIDEKDSLI